MLELFWLESENWDLDLLLGRLIFGLKYIAKVFDKFFQVIFVMLIHKLHHHIFNLRMPHYSNIRVIHQF
jgi:hypothetical protein